MEPTYMEISYFLYLTSDQTLYSDCFELLKKVKYFGVLGFKLLKLFYIFRDILTYKVKKPLTKY